MEWMQNDFTPMRNFSASVFETTIRVIGGCLAAYEMTGDPILLKRRAPSLGRGGVSGRTRFSGALA